MSDLEIPIIHIKDNELKIAYNVFRAINHPLRKQICKIIEAMTQATVTEIYRGLKIEQSVASLHLKFLREAHIVRTERKGRFIMYMPDYIRATKLKKIIAQIIEEVILD